MNLQQLVYSDTVLVLHRCFSLWAWHLEDIRKTNPIQPLSTLILFQCGKHLWHYVAWHYLNMKESPWRVLVVSAERKMQVPSITNGITGFMAAWISS